MKDGIFSATERGFHGPVTTDVSLKDGKVTKIDLKGLVPYTVGETAAKNMAQKIEAAGSPDVDVLTGASYSSDSVKKAVKKAIKLANGELSQDEADNPNYENFTKPQVPKHAQPVSEKIFASDVNFSDEYDVIVAGSGAAGLATAVEAARQGLKVMIFEKDGIAGGTTKYSEGEVQAAGTPEQKEFSRFKDDTPERHAQELIKVGGERVDKDLITDYAQDAPKIISWLKDMGIKWTGVFGAKWIPSNKDTWAYRTHYYEHGGVSGSGIILVNTLLREALKAGAKISYDSPVIALINKSAKDHSVVGVGIENNGTRKYYRAKKGVVLATAGVDHNEELSKQFSPINYYALKNGQVNTNNSNTGDGITLGLNNQAAVTGFGGIVGFGRRLCLPRDEWGTLPVIFVNGEGRRYVDEEESYGWIVLQNFLQHEITKKDNWAIFDKRILGQKNAWKDEQELAKDIERGFVVSANSVADLTQKIGVDPEILEHTVKTWNSFVENDRDLEFGRRTGMQDIKAPYYAFHMVDMSFSAIGGLKVNTDQQVIDNNGQVIDGLYAAGLNAGGLIGNAYYSSGLAIGSGLHQGRKAAWVLSKK